MVNTQRWHLEQTRNDLTMKRTLRAALAALLLCGAAQAQWTSITASNIHDAAGNNLAHGRIQFVGTDQNDQSISYRSGSGQTIKTPVTCTVVAGAITSPSPCRVADTALTAPAHICYRISVIDSSTGKQVLYYPQPAQKPACGSQPTGSTWNLDDFSPPYTPMAMIQTGPTGAQGPRGYPGFNCTNSSSLGAWNSGTPYTAGECVYYGSSPALLYAALQNGTGEQPDLHSDYWFNLDQWATGTVGQHLTFALTGTPQAPPAPYSISGMSVACDNVDYTYAAPAACSHLLVNTGAQAWNTEFYRCNEYIPTGAPGGINCVSTPPYMLPHWVALNLGTTESAGALGWTNRLDGYPYANVIAHEWYFNSLTCGAGPEAGDVLVMPGTSFDPLTTMVQIENVSLSLYPTASCVKLKILSTYDPRIVPPSFSAGGSAIRVWAANVAGAGITTAATFKNKPIIDVRDYGVDCESTPTSAVDSSYAINRLITMGQHVSFKGCAADNKNFVRVDSPALLQAVRSVDFDGGGVVPGAGGPGYGGVTIFGCNGTAGDYVIEGNGLGMSKIHGFNIVPDGGSAGWCGVGVTSNFKGCVGLRRTTGFALTPTQVMVYDNHCTPDNGAADPSTVTDFMGISLPDSDNNENMHFWNNNIDCEHAANSIGVNISDGVSDNGVVEGGSINNCRYLGVNRGHFTFRNINGSGSGDYQYFNSGAGGGLGCAFAVGGGSITRIEGMTDTETSGPFLCLAPGVSDAGLVTLKDNEMGPDINTTPLPHIAPGVHVIDVGTGATVILQGHNRTFASGQSIIGSSTTINGGIVVSEEPLSSYAAPGLLDPHSPLAYYGPEQIPVDLTLTATRGGGGGLIFYNSSATVAQATSAGSSAVAFDDFVPGRNVLATDFSASVTASSLQFYHRVNQTSDLAITEHVEVHDSKTAGGFSTVAASTIPATTLSVHGTAGSDTYGYKIVGISGGGNTYTSTEATITGPNHANLGASNYVSMYNYIPLGHHTLQVWRTTTPSGGPAVGLIAVAQPAEMWNFRDACQLPVITDHPQGCFGGNTGVQAIYFYDVGQAPITAGSPPSANTADGRAILPGGVQPAATGGLITWFQTAIHAALDLGSVANAACSSETTETITGAALGDSCSVATGSALEAGGSFRCAVTAADTVKWQLCNLSGSAIDRASDTYTIRVVR